MSASLEQLFANLMTPGRGTSGLENDAAFAGVPGLEDLSPQERVTLIEMLQREHRPDDQMSLEMIVAVTKLTDAVEKERRKEVLEKRTAAEEDPARLLLRNKRGQAQSAARGERRDVAVQLVNQANAFNMMGQNDKAVKAAKEACDVYEALRLEGVELPERHQALAAYAGSLGLAGRTKESKDAWLACRKDSLSLGLGRSAAGSLVAAANMLDAMGQVHGRTALSYRETALGELDGLVKAGNPDPELPTTYSNALWVVADEYFNRSRFTEAVVLYRKLAQWFEKLGDAEEQADAWLKFAVSSVELEKWKDANEGYVQALALYPPSRAEDAALCAFGSGGSYSRLSNWAGATACMDYALSRYCVLGTNPALVAQCVELLESCKRAKVPEPSPVYGRRGPMPQPAVDRVKGPRYLWVGKQGAAATRASQPARTAQSTSSAVPLSARARQPSPTRAPAHTPAAPETAPASSPKKKNKKKKKRRKTATGDEVGSGGEDLDKLLEDVD